MACLAMIQCSPGGDSKGVPTGSGGNAGAGAAEGQGTAAEGGGGQGQGSGFGLAEGQGASRPGTDTDGGCASSVEDGTQIPANLMFVIDRSGSMNCCPPPVTDSATCENFPVQDPGCADSKWAITRDALIGAIGGLRGLGHISVGLTMFPTDNACGFPTGADVEMQLLDEAHYGTVETFLEGVAPAGKTPLAGATLETYAYLQDTFEARLRSENTFVIVVTDGADTCAASEMDRLVDELAAAASGINIRTFVIGAPGSEPARLALSKLAYAGGTARSADCDHGQSASGSGADGGDDAATGGSTAPSADTVCHFDMTTATDFATELGETLDAITRTRELSCEFDVPTSSDGRPADRDKVNVTFQTTSGAEPVLQDASLQCNEGAEGWQYSEDRNKIILCGSICDRVQAVRDGRIEIVLGCPTEILIR
jgi:hypothetical protein